MRLRLGISELALNQQCLLITGRLECLRRKIDAAHVRHMMLCRDTGRRGLFTFLFSILINIQTSNRNIFEVNEI